MECVCMCRSVCKCTLKTHQHAGSLLPVSVIMSNLHQYRRRLKKEQPSDLSECLMEPPDLQL